MRHVSPDPPERAGGLSRRTALKTGALGSALLWTAPTIQVLGVAAAHADVASGSPPPPPPSTGDLPSHGFALVDCGDGVFAVKIEGKAPYSLGSLGRGNDVPFLESKGLILGEDYRQATAADLACLAGHGATVFDPDGGGPAGTLPALYITLGPGGRFVDGYTYVFDGSFAGGGENCGDGDKFTTAVLSGSTVYFSVYCNEGSAGEA
ncbi:MAG: hypothetical protein ACOYXW_12510 [Actinomycetota bacterium]